MARAFTSTVPPFVAGRVVTECRETIIVATPALHERAHAKAAALIEAMAAALADRGLARPSALLASQIGMATFGRAIDAWGGKSASELEELIAAATAEVRELG